MYELVAPTFCLCLCVRALFRDHEIVTSQSQSASETRSSAPTWIYENQMSSERWETRRWTPQNAVYAVCLPSWGTQFCVSPARRTVYYVQLRVPGNLVTFGWQTPIARKYVSIVHERTICIIQFPNDILTCIIIRCAPGVSWILCKYHSSKRHEMCYSHRRRLE